MIDTPYNQYYLSFPEFEHDDRFRFPGDLCRLSHQAEDNLTRNGDQSVDPLYKFDIGLPSEVVGPTGCDLSAVYLGMDNPPDSLSSGLHRCIMYFSSPSEEGMLAVGRGTLVVLQKWKTPS